MGCRGTQARPAGAGKVDDGMKVVVLAGGLSPEREVSLCSGSLIANALMEKGHRVLLLDVYEGMPVLPADPGALFRRDRAYRYDIREEVPDLAALRARVGIGNALVGPNVPELCRLADRVFLALHGAMGENGQLQAFLDSCGIGYTGSDYTGCLLSMDKDLSKRLLRDAGVPTPDWMDVDAGRDSPEDVLAQIGLPCVVKPCGCGSSVGVSMVDTREQLAAALAGAACWDRRVLVERRIIGRELTIGVLGGRVLPPVEIIPQQGFYDYKNKYQGTTREVCPAELDPEVTAELGRLALLGFAALRLKHYARLDFMLDRQGRLWCLEANSLPGMTPQSLLPQEAAAVGMSYPELCETILYLGY